MNCHAITRRGVLQGGASLVVSFSLGMQPALAEKGAASFGSKAVALDQVDTFLVIERNGDISIYTNKVDIGTGVKTAFTQIAADELVVPMEKVAVIEGDTWLTPDQLGSGGSLSIQVGGIQIRQACATARRALLERASKTLGVSLDALTVDAGVVRSPGGGKRVSYGELVGGGRFELVLDPKAPTRAPTELKFVGKPVARLDIPAKVYGTFTYIHDLRVPNMVHGRVIRPPAIGAELISYDAGTIRGIPGIVKIVHEKNFLGVVAESEWAAIKAADTLKTEWTKWEGLPDMADTYKYVRSTPVAKEEVTASSGNASRALAEAGTVLSAAYEFAIHTHGSIGPSCAIAEWKDGKITCWSPTQGTHECKKMLATNFGLPEADIHIIYVDGSGCYGRNGHEDATAEAVVMSRAVGRPVRVQWMRHEEHGWDPKGPATVADMKGALDRDGNVLAWHAEHWAPLHQSGSLPLAPSLVGIALGLPQPGPGFGNMHSNSKPDYSFANTQVVAHRLKNSMLRGSWIRTPGRMQNNFANESFLDELAAEAKADPVEFRLRHIRDERGAACIKAAAERFQWETRPSPTSSTGGNQETAGRGIAYIQYDGVRTYAAGIAEVKVNRTTGAIRCTRFVVAHDCGQVINPDGVRNQVEGCVIQTLSRTMFEQVSFDRSNVTSVDWASYPIITFPDVPVIDVVVIDRPGMPPWGAGEPAAAIVPAAIANAVFDASGVRMRTIPFTPQRFKAAATG